MTSTTARLKASICLFDHRGQGLSDRLISDERKGYVKWFSDYAKDLKSIRDAVLGLGHDRVFLLGHSMGGGIAVYTAMMYPDAFTGLALTAPMVAINTAPYPRSVAYSVAATLTFWWQGETFVLGVIIGSPPAAMKISIRTTSPAVEHAGRWARTSTYGTTISILSFHLAARPIDGSGIYPGGLVDDVESPQAQGPNPYYVGW